MNGKGQIVNDQKLYTTEHYMKAETEQTLLKLLLGTETRASLTFLGGRVQGSS